MEALLTRAAAMTAVMLFLAPDVSLGAQFRTPNFVVEARSAQHAEQIGRMAEKCRRELAEHWLGETLPNWSQPCPITVEVGNVGAGGATSFLFNRGEVYGWRMNIQGTLERLLDSVVPHEVTHTIFASHFRQPLPRWADEGACTTVEHRSEKFKQQKMLIEFLRTSRGIPFSRMFMMKEYPDDIMPLYSQGYSLTNFLIQNGGHRKFIEYVGDGLKDEQWTEITRQHYGFSSLAELQDAWLDWVKKGSPQASPVNAVVASNDRRRPEQQVRGQSPDSAGQGSPTNDVATNNTPVNNTAASGAGLAGDETSDGSLSAVSRTSTPGSEPESVYSPGWRAARARQRAAGRQPSSEGAAASRQPGPTQLSSQDNPPAGNMGEAARIPNAPPSSTPARPGPAGKKVLLEWNREEMSRTESAPHATPQRVGYQPEARGRILHDATADRTMR